MNRYLAVALAALTLTACSSSSHQPSTTSAPTPSYSSKEQFFLDTVSTIPHLKSLPDKRLLTKGARVCHDLDHGAGVVELAFKNMKDGVLPDQAGWLIGLSVYSLCPRYRPIMHKWSTEVHDKDYRRWKAHN